MKLYVKACSSFRVNIADFDIKKELKQTYKLDTRRQDTFIHLALYGALKLKDEIQIREDDELYVTSGTGNMEVMQKSNLYVNENKEFLRPFDFINMLGNTTSYYVASALGMKGKNIYQISNSFTYMNTLISVYTSLLSSKKDAVLGSIDLSTTPETLIKTLLGVGEEIKMTSSVNYQKLSLSDEDAKACIEFDLQTYSLQEVQELIKDVNCDIKASKRCSKLTLSQDEEFFETMASYYVNESIRLKKDLMYIDCLDDRYKVIKISTLFS